MLALGGSGVGRVVNFLGQVVLARWLGPAALGLYALGWGAFRLLTLPATLGLHNGVQRYGSIARSRGGLGGRGLLDTVLRVTLLSSAVVATVFLGLSPWLAGRMGENEGLLPVFVVFGLALPAAGLLRVAAAATRVSQDLRVSVLTVDFGQPFVFATLAGLVLWLGGGVLAVSVASALSFVTMASVAVYWALRWFPRDSAGDSSPPLVGTGKLLAYSIPTALAGTIGVTMTWLDRLLVGYYLTTEAVGWYQVAAQASGIFAVILAAFNAIFTPMIAGLLERREEDRLQELYRVVTKWGILAVLPGAALCLLFARESVAAIFGAPYLPAAGPLVVLVIGQLVHVMTGAVGYLLMMSGRPNLWLGLSVGALAADCVLNVLLIPRFGLIGAAAATTISVAVLFLTGLVMVRRRLGLWPHDRRFAPVLLTAVLVAAAALAFRAVNDLGPVATVACVLIGAGVITLASWRAFCFEAADRLLVARLMRR